MTEFFYSASDKLVANMQNAMEVTQRKLDSGRMAFYLPSQQLILSLHGALHSAQPTDTSATCRQLFDSMRNISACDHADKRRRKNVDSAQVGSCLELTKRVTNESIITLGNLLK